MVSVSNAPKSWTFFWWHEGQNQRPLHENAPEVLPNSSDFMKEFGVSRRTVARDLD